MSRRRGYRESNGGRHVQIGHPMVQGPGLRLPGRSYNPPDIISCPIDNVPAVRQPDGSYICQNGHVTVRTVDGGFAPAKSAIVQFARDDCTIFDRYPKSVPWNAKNVSPEDQTQFISVRGRLKLLSGQLRASTQIGISLKAFTSLYQANGKTVSHIWCCVYPAAVSNKSYALQAALIISAYGAEACICLGAGRSQIRDNEKLAEAELAFKDLQTRLGSVPTMVAENFVRRLPKEVVYRNSWREFGGSSDFDTLSDWLAYAASPDGAQASISRYFDVDELERLGPNVTNIVLELANAGAPLFQYCYPSHVEEPIDPNDNAVHFVDTGGAVNVGEAEVEVLASARPTLLAGAAADTVPEPGDGQVRAADRLNITTDVDMLVSVLLATDTPLPLAVGLFGDWGSGKSFFMALMQERIDELAHLAADGRPEALPFCRKVCQVRFNAWHYVDANLWASLAATLFDELALADLPGETQARQTAFDVALQQADQARKDRQKLEDAVAELEAAADRPTAAIRVSVPEALRAVRDEPELLSDLRDAGRDDGAGQDETATDPSMMKLVDALGEVDSAAGKAGAAWQLFQAEVLHDRRWVTLVTLLVFIGAGAFILAAAGWSTGLKVLAVVGAVAAGLSPALDGTVRVLRLVRKAREARERPLEEKRDELALAQKREKDAEEEVAQRQQDLAELRDKGLELQKLVRERAASSDYRGQLGVISKIRRDFEQLVVLVCGDQATGAKPSTPVAEVVPKVERIVLFIDDLDRCPHDKVVEVLQAVYLLLAFKLFVVVVGVDSRWLERSLRAHYHDLLEEPASYLEKIFQIPFMLKPMADDGYRKLIDGLTTPSNQSSESNVSSDDETESVPEDSDETGDIESDPEGDTSDVIPPIKGMPAEPLPLPRPQALVISDPERNLLGKVGDLVPTPRAAKRLVNIYRMLRVSVLDDELEAFLPGGGNEYQAVVLLLGILIGRPSWAHKVFKKLETSSDADDVWKVLEKFTEVYERLETIRGDIKVTQVGPYRRWVPRVARFSFRFSDIRSRNEESTSIPQRTDRARD
jgi:hypothetical protein